MAAACCVFLLYSFGIGLEGQLLALVLHEANCSMELVIATRAEYHIALSALQLSLFLTAIALPSPPFSEPPNHLEQLRALTSALFSRLPRSSALAGQLLLQPFLAGQADEGLAAPGEERSHLIEMAKLAVHLIMNRYIL